MNRCRYQRNATNKWNVTCSQCGMTGLKWRLVNGWQLFENVRVEHNRLKVHACTTTAADDFEVVADA